MVTCDDVLVYQYIIHTSCDSTSDGYSVHLYLETTSCVDGDDPLLRCRPILSLSSKNSFFLCKDLPFPGRGKKSDADMSI